jgi:integrase
VGSLYKPSTVTAVPGSALIRQEQGTVVATWTKAGRRISGPVLEGSEPLKARVPQPIWWADWTDAEGKRHRQSTGCRDQALARRWLAEREAEVELERAGVVTREDRRVATELARPLEEHLAAFSDSMVAAGRADGHRRTTLKYVRVVAKNLEWSCLRDVDRSGMERWLAAAERRGMSARSRNAHLVAVKSLLNWAKRADRLRTNTLEGIPRANERADVRRKRRALTEAELVRIFEAAERRPLQEAAVVRRGPRKGTLAIRISPARRQRLVLLGLERSLTYRALFFTGLRVNELRSIRVCDLRLDSPQPHLVLAARAEKSRRGAVIALRPDLVDQIRKVHQLRLEQEQGASDKSRAPGLQLDPQSPAFRVPAGLLRILNRDLLAAGIAKRSPDGRTYDLHAFRTTLCTHLFRAGVPLRTAQAVMRHSNPALTANIYTDAELLQLDAAVASLPACTSGYEAAHTL